MAEGSSAMKAISIFLLILQGTILPLLVRYSRVRDTDVMYISTTTVFLNEVLKLVICFIVLFFFVEKSAKSFFQNLYDAIIGNPVETLKVCVPSLVYTIQNNLYFIALSNLDASTYCVDTKGEQVLGLTAVLCMCLTSGFAGVYFEKMLKGSKTNLWLQNVRLALLGLPITFGAMMVNDGAEISRDGAMKGIDWLVWLIIFLNAGGGLVVAMVVKYADNIAKAYAQSTAIVAAVCVSMFLFGLSPSVLFIAGTALVCLSVYLYAKYPPPPQPIAADATTKKTD